MTRYCKDCKFSEKTRLPFLLVKRIAVAPDCQHPKSAIDPPTRSPVTGRAFKARYHQCWIQRHSLTLAKSSCGLEGKWFEPITGDPV